MIHPYLIFGDEGKRMTWKWADIKKLCKDPKWMIPTALIILTLIIAVEAKWSPFERIYVWLFVDPVVRRVSSESSSRYIDSLEEIARLERRLGKQPDTELLLKIARATGERDRMGKQYSLWRNAPISAWVAVAVEHTDRRINLNGSEGQMVWRTFGTDARFYSLGTREVVPTSWKAVTAGHVLIMPVKAMSNTIISGPIGIYSPQQASR